MATGGVEADGLVTCSICLEPYRGREPKLLPCLHTFCLPCLTKLVTRKDAAQTPGTAGPDTEEEEGGGSAHSLTCPTCRRVTPLPPGGVAGFQKNIYLDSSSREEEEDPQPAPCTLCDGDHTAQVHCRQCQNNVCSQCRRYHDKCCRGGQVRALQDPSDSSSSSTAQKPSHGQVRQQQQLQRTGEAVKKLGEEERKLKQEREAMDHSINARYANLLCRAADARDACKQSLREACDGLTVQLHSSMAEARHAQDTLQRQLSPSQPAPVATAQQRAALFLQGELQTILDRDLDTCSLLRHHTEDNPSLMTSLLHAFMGNVVKGSQASGPGLSQQQPSQSPSVHDDRAAMASPEAAARSLNDLYEKLEDLAGQVTLLQSANSQLATDHSSLQSEVTTLKDKNATLTTQQAALQSEVTTLKDKSAIVHQDLAVLAAEKDNACAQLTRLRTDLTTVQTDTARQQTDILQLKADHGHVLAKVSTAVGALQEEHGSEVKGDVVAKLQGRVADVEASHSRLLAETTASHSRMDGLQQRIQLGQGALQDNIKALTTLQSRFETAHTQVGFCACLSETLTIFNDQTLICDKLVSNVGGGYDNTAGVFTAPLTGTYLFLATASLSQPDSQNTALLSIAVDGLPKVLTLSNGHSLSTTHTVVRLTAGQKVTLVTHLEQACTFVNLLNHFSGALLQADA